MKVVVLILQILLALIVLPFAVICGVGAFGLTVYLIEKAIFADREKLKEVNNRLGLALQALKGEGIIDVDAELDKIVKTEDNE